LALSASIYLAVASTLAMGVVAFGHADAILH
jgi:hypothetical protein